MTQANERRVVWIGSCQGGLGWLKQRIDGKVHGQRCSAIAHHSFDIGQQELGLLVERGVDRIILACPDRLSFPNDLVSFLQEHCPDVPFAVACDNWWDGSRRTGLGPVAHTQWPWYRWWDGWFDWLTGEAAELFAPFPSSVRRTTHNSNLPKLSQCVGLVVGDCRQSREAWCAAASQVGSRSLPTSALGFQLQIKSDPGWLADFQWVLWDDSCLSTTQDPASAELSITRFFETMVSVHPPTVGIVAVGIPRVDILQSLGEKVEVIAKPCDLTALDRLLHCHFAPAASSAALART